MSSLGKKLILGVVGLLGVNGLGTIISGSISIASGSPIKEVAKDVAVSSAKDSIMNNIWGSSDDGFSIKDLCTKAKYKSVSDKKSGPIGYIASGWYAEVYRIEKDIYVGNRRFNKANGTNMKWSAVDGTSFEIGNFKKSVANSDSYLAYDSSTYLFVVGELKKYKLNGYCLVYNEYDKTYVFNEYTKGKATGYSIKITDDGILYYKGDDVVGEYDLENDEFEITKSSFLNKIKEPSEDIDIDVAYGDDYTFNIGDRIYNIVPSSDYISYKSASCEFSGNAYSFNCKYNYKGDEYVTYDFTTLTHLVVECSDGTYGEINIVDEDDTSDSALTLQAISEALTKVGVKAVTETVVDSIENGVPQLKAIDTMLELITGEGLSDRISSKVEDTIDAIKEDDTSVVDKITETYDNLTDEDDYHSLGDKIKDGLGIETYEEKKDRERKERDEAIHEAFQNQNEDGSYTLPNGIKIY